MSYKRYLVLATAGLLAAGLATGPAATAKSSKKTTCVTSTLDASGKQLQTSGPLLSRDADLTTDTLTVYTREANEPCSTAVYTVSYTDNSGVAHPTQFTDVQPCPAGQTTDCASAVGDGTYSLTFVISGISTSNLAMVGGTPSVCPGTTPPPYFQTTAAENITDVVTQGQVAGSTLIDDDPCSPGSGWF